jgi:hypothetical protein
VIDEGFVGPHIIVAQDFRRHLDFSLDFVVVGNLLDFGLRLLDDTKAECDIEFVD